MLQLAKQFKKILREKTRVFIVYDSVANSINNARLQFITIELDKDSSSLPKTYTDYSNIFNPSKTAKLQIQIYTTHAINLEKGAKASYGPIYHLSKLELRILRDYLAENE
jgi:hypothetical protein